MDDSQGQDLNFIELISLGWQKSAPYRAGFVLGTLAVSATLILIFTGRRSPRLELESKSSVLINEASSSAKTAEIGNGEPVTRVKGSSDSAKRIGNLIKRNITTKKSQGFVRKASAPINLNTASQAQIESLPKIGPVTAKKIIDYRIAFGPFKSLADLSKVKGIGPKTLEKIKDLARFD